MPANIYTHSQQRIALIFFAFCPTAFACVLLALAGCRFLLAGDVERGVVAVFYLLCVGPFYCIGSSLAVVHTFDGIQTNGRLRDRLLALNSICLLAFLSPWVWLFA